MSTYTAMIRVVGYYEDAHNQIGYDNQASPIYAYYNCDPGYTPCNENAYWDPVNLVMVFGGYPDPGPSIAKDITVAGHEFTHGVINGLAPLEYHDQPGALNESIADVMGTLVIANLVRADLGQDPTATFGVYLPDPIRNLADPSQSDPPQPSKMSDYVALPNTADGDHGGVHINNGITSSAMYAIWQAHGSEVLGDLVYGVISGGYLMPEATFADFSNAMAEVCAQLYGPGDPRCTTVKQAYTAVGLGPDCGDNCQPPSSCACDTDATSCQAGCDCDPQCLMGAAPHVDYCACDTDTGCTAGCGCDPECDANGQAICQADGTCDYANCAYDPDCDTSSVTPSRLSQRGGSAGSGAVDGGKAGGCAFVSSGDKDGPGAGALVPLVLLVGLLLLARTAGDRRRDRTLGASRR